MPIIDSKKGAKFDALIRGNKSDALISFIMATSTVPNNNNRKFEISKRLKSAFELFRENIKGTDSGAGNYGVNENNLEKQFNSYYTMGYEMGIWQDNKFSLNPLAKDVAKYNITVSFYIGVVFKNLFAYYEKNGKVVYHHFLYEILSKMKNVGTNKITKEEIAETLSGDRVSEQANLIFNYLISSDLFEKIDNKTMGLSEFYQDDISKLMDLCNLEYIDLPQDEAITMFSDKKFYADYVTKLKNNKNVDNTEDKKINWNRVLESDFLNNRIIFGAPGTGKSYKFNKEMDNLLNEGGEFERVTFHPDYSYANFVGTYKPTMINNDISYKYIPGPFMRLYAKALKNLKNDILKPQLLIIEEINRANVSAVFGDIFQLLDRNEDGISEYSIEASEDVKQYLAEEVGGSPDDYTKLRIPSNMFIWATMNSADQGVFPMDTAFKRRWNFEYLGIDDGQEDMEPCEVALGKGDNEVIVEWNELRKAINEMLSSYKLNEDKLLGPFFLSQKLLRETTPESSEKFIEMFKSKVIMYLFEDAARQRRNDLFVGVPEKDRYRYSEICKEFDSIGIGIFGPKIFEILGM